MDIHLIPNSWKSKRYLLEGAAVESTVSFRKVLLLHTYIQIYQAALVLATLLGKDYLAKKQEF